MYIPEFLQNRAYLLTIIGFITAGAALGPFFVEEFSPEAGRSTVKHLLVNRQTI